MTDDSCLRSEIVVCVEVAIDLNSIHTYVPSDVVERLHAKLPQDRWRAINFHGALFGFVHQGLRAWCARNHVLQRPEGLACEARV